jgi:hypothetical protein
MDEDGGGSGFEDEMAPPLETALKALAAESGRNEYMQTQLLLLEVQRIVGEFQAASLSQQPVPVVIAGDFNSTPGSSPYTLLASGYVERDNVSEDDPVGIIASLPLVSLITFVWIYYGMKEIPAERVEKLASHSAGVFWFVLPSLPMFLVFPVLLRKGIHFWPSLVICCLLTMVLYAGMAYLLKRFGVAL